MKATISYVEKKFEEFNLKIFAEKLPKLPIVLSNSGTFLGQCTYKIRKDENGNEEKYDFKLRINTRIDLEEDVLEDTIIHEMIHYFIEVNKFKDTAAHGELFKHFMNAINERYGRHITISHKGTTEEMEQAVDTRAKWHVIVVLHLKNGKMGVKVLPRVVSRIVHFYNVIKEDTNIQSVQLYLHNNPYFNRFPNSSALTYEIVDPEEFTQHLDGAKPLSCDGDSVR